jgi:hypothetical protein
MILTSLLLYFQVVKGGDLMHVESLNNFKGLCILRPIWCLENLGTCFFLFWQLKVFVSLSSHVQKQPRLQDFLTKMRTKACLIPNLDHEKKNHKNKNTTCAKQESNKNLLQK